MGITNANKTISTDRIDCNGSLRVTLALTAAPDITTNPTDIMLVLDRSGSMSGTALANMKIGAKTFIDIIAEATGGTASGQIGSGSRIGIVSFADTATVNAMLMTSVANLKNAVDSLTANGDTNHADAFTKATQSFQPQSNNAKVIVMFTDGNTTTGPAPAPVAAAARAQGITIYAIGLIGTNGIDVSALNDWATDPNSSHVAVTPNSEDLETLFEDLAQNITNAGATDIVIDEVVNSDFTITGALIPSKGTATMLGPHSLRWNIPELGVNSSESATLEFFIRHTSHSSGTKLVNQSIDYSDNEGNVVTFPAPSVLVECDVIVNPECHPKPIDLHTEGCSDSVDVDAGDLHLESLGRIVQTHVTLKNVCPGRRTALAAILTEVDSDGNEHNRGMKIMTIPAHHHSACRDIRVRNIRFVLPEDLDVNERCDEDNDNCCDRNELNFSRRPNHNNRQRNALCNCRNFRVRFIAHPIDSDYQVCETEMSM